MNSIVKPRKLLLVGLGLCAIVRSQVTIGSADATSWAGGKYQRYVYGTSVDVDTLAVSVGQGAVWDYRSMPFLDTVDIGRSSPDSSVATLFPSATHVERNVSSILSHYMGAASSPDVFCQVDEVTNDFAVLRGIYWEEEQGSIVYACSTARADTLLTFPLAYGERWTVPPQLGQRRGSTSYTSLMSDAHGSAGSPQVSGTA